MPHQFDGVRIEPPMSLPSSRAVSPVATATAAPPEEPPLVREGSHGLLVVPKSGLYVCTSPASAGTFVLPNTTTPDALSRSTATASVAGTWAASGWWPQVVRSPAVSKLSLMVIGRPW